MEKTIYTIKRLGSMISCLAIGALDLSLLVTVQVFAGVLLSRPHAWGHAVGAIAGIQGSLYLLVLSVNHCDAEQITLLDLETGETTAVGLPAQVTGDVCFGSLRCSPKTESKIGLWPILMPVATPRRCCYNIAERGPTMAC